MLKLASSPARCRIPGMTSFECVFNYNRKAPPFCEWGRQEEFFSGDDILNLARMIAVRSVVVCLAYLAGTVSSQYVCPMEWESFEQSCYKFVVYPERNFNEATSDCVRSHSALVSVNSFSEHNFIEQKISQMSLLRANWYTSGVLQPGDKFRWGGDGSDVDMTPGNNFWINDEAPLDKLSGRYIIYTYENGRYGWKRSDPTLKMGYICETPLAEVYKTLQDERGIDYGLDFVPHLADIERGPSFLLDAQDTVIVGRPKRAYIECVATGKPAPTYTWRNGTIGSTVISGKGMELTSAVNQRYTQTNGRLTFEDPSSQTEAAYYQCRASNKFGTIISPPVQVSFGKLGEFPNVGVSAVLAYAYNGAQLECPSITAEPAKRYQWAKERPTAFVRPEYLHYIFISSNGKLYFSEVTEPDHGYYYCVVTLTRPASSEAYIGSSQTPSATAIKIQLNVADPVGGQNKPEILDEFISVFPTNPKRGDTIRLECFAYGTLPLQYSWLRLGRKSMPVKSRLRDHNRVLEIEDVSEDDAGQYQCNVFSSKTRQSDSKQFTLSIQSKPYFREPLKDQLVDKGSQLTWRCYAAATPPETYVWFKNGQPLAGVPGEIEIQKNTLVIRNLQKEKHDGMYQCAAKNEYGIAFSSAQLRVLEFAPTFRKQADPGTNYATLGGNATLECNPEAAPFPTFKWFKDGGDLGLNLGDTTSRVRMIPGGDLMITNIQYSDSGQYRCEATNTLGSDSINSMLVILQSTTINRPPFSDDVLVNETSFLTCQASYSPGLDMIYIWRFNGVPIDVDKNPFYSWGTGVNQGGLYIRNAQFEHEGRYTCVARTQTDEVTASAYVTVKGPPGQPAGVFGVTTSITSTSIQLKWTPGDDHGDPVSTYVVEAATVFENYTVWRVVKDNIYDSNANDNSDTGSTRKTTVLTTLTPGTPYKFRVRARNTFGLGVHSQPSVIYPTLGDKPTKIVEEVGGGGGKVGDLTITWKPLDPVDHHGEKIGYAVYWRRKGLRVTDVDWEKGVVYGNASRYVHTVGQAYFYTEYEVKVQALNIHGAGPNSSIQIIYSAEDLPVATPGTPYGEGFNATCLRIYWNPVSDNRQQVKGKLLGYKINYWKLDVQKELEATQAILHGQRDRGLIIGLEHDTFYEFNIQAYNSAGNGPKSETFRQTTFHLPPMHYPTEVSIHSVSEDTVEVKWRGVSTNHGEEPLQGYKIRYWVFGTDIRNASDVDTGRTPKGRIIGLQKNTLYNLRVLAYSRGGDGKMSMPPLYFSMENSQIRYDPSQTELLATSSQLLPSFFITSVSLLLIAFYLH